MNNKLKATAMDSVTELSPKMKRPRSTFNLMLKDYTSFNVGELTPIGGFTEVLPGDTFNVNLDLFLRMTSNSKRPPMDQLHMDVYAFFVPYRFLDKGWAQIQGENAEAWVAPSKTCSLLRLGDPKSITIGCHSLLAHLGVPGGIYLDNDETLELNIYPVYSYFKIVNDWFRDENIQDELAFDTTNNVYHIDNLAEINGHNIASNGSLWKVAKYHDIFTSALPAPAKVAGGSVKVPMASSAPVGIVPTANQTLSSNAVPVISSGNNLVNGTFEGFITTNANGAPSVIADLSQAAATINELRLAVQLQRAYELDARSGTRLTEAIEARFGVKNPDLRLGRSELLGHYRFDIGMSEIATTVGNNASTTASVLGNATYAQGVGVGNSKSGNSQHICVKSFTEHGIFMILGCIRPDLTYQAGLSKFWRKKSRWDFFEPVFGALGETAIMKSELLAPVAIHDDSVFGYQEAWYEYRYKQNNVSGLLSTADNSGFDIFHYAMDWESVPTLSEAFIQQHADAIDRTLLIPSGTVDQFLLNAQGVIKATRVMPLFSVPGLIDHF